MPEPSTIATSPFPAAASPPGAAIAGSLATALHWIGKGVLAVADQALFAGGNFLVNILLARWMTPTEYGAFALAYAVFLLFAAVHAAVFVEPMVVFGSGKYADQPRRYFSILVRGHFLVMLPASLVLAAVGLGLGRIYDTSVERAFFGLVAGAAFMLLLWLVRRMFYVHVRPGRAVVAAAVYLGVAVAAVWTLEMMHRLSTFSAFLAMAAASLAASVISLAQLRPERHLALADPAFATVMTDHWRYGRWATATAVVNWLPLNIYYALLPAWIGLPAAGALRALMNLAMPVLQTISALSMLLLPMLVRHRQWDGPRKMARTMYLSTVLFCAGASAYLALLWPARTLVMGWLYAGKYDAYASWPLALAALLPFTSCVSAAVGGGLRALERPDCIFWCYLASGVATLVVGIPLAAAYGVGGALAGLLISSAIAAAAMIGFSQHVLKRER
jgi:O-antigen/teichoic acid export membrane protein